MQFRVPGHDETFEMVSKPTFGEARAIEKVTGIPFAKMQADPTAQTIDATQAFLWVSMKRKVPTLTFSDLDDVAIDGIEWMPDADEEQPGEGEAPDPTDADVAS